MDQQLTSLDATFLELEQADEGSTMHIGAALVFDPVSETGAPPPFEDLVALLDDRLGLLPRFRCRLSAPRAEGLRRPSWVADPAFALDAHVRHATLPAPGRSEDVHEWLGDFWSHRLDRGRPLWEMTLVDGLEGGRWMLATKTHHAMVDGVGSVDIGHVLLDAELDPEPRPAPAPAAEEDEHGDGLPGWFPPVLAARLARAALGTVRHPGRVLEAAGDAAAMAEVLWRDEVLAARPSSLNVDIGATRSFGTATLDLAEVKGTGKALGGTVNDVVLTVATGALRELLLRRGEDVQRPLRAMVPVNLRPADEGGGAGNFVTSLFAELPIGEADPIERFAKTRAAAQELKSGTAARGGSTIVATTSVMPPVLHETVAKMLFAPRLFNLTITNVPGPQIPLYALGARLRDVLPLVPLFAGHSVGIAVVSYDGSLTFGVNADRAAVPDADVLVDGVPAAFAELRALA
jgi:WS/DGAT/MGAT family acyltransferase